MFFRFPTTSLLVPTPAFAQPADEPRQTSKPNQQNHGLALTELSFTDARQGGRKEWGTGAEGRAVGFFSAAATA